MRARVFRDDRRGNVGLLTAIAMMALLPAVGLAVDYGRASTYKSRLQTATDATALAMAHLPPGLSQAEIERRGREFFRAGMPDFRASGENWMQVEAATGRMNVKVDSAIETVILGIIGHHEMAVAASSEVAWGFTKVEVALVLDTTGSMSRQGRMTALKTAARDFVNILEKVNIDETVKIGIVPYDVQVRIDPATFRNANWIDFRSGRKYPQVRNTTPLQPETNRNAWNGCLADAPKPHDISDALSDAATRPPAIKCETAGSINSAFSISGLTQNFAALRTQISNLNANGATNIPIGMVWGMSLLSNNGPFKDAAPASKDLEKAIVLLTDGDNTRDAFGGNGSSRYPAADERLRKLCAEARGRGYTIYTILLMEGNDTLLRNCATKKGVPDPSKFKEVKQAAELIPVFQQIANELSDLRIAK